jgi:hypothetical protein
MVLIAIWDDRFAGDRFDGISRGVVRPNITRRRRSGSIVVAVRASRLSRAISCKHDTAEERCQQDNLKKRIVYLVFHMIIIHSNRDF